MFAIARGIANMTCDNTAEFNPSKTTQTHYPNTGKMYRTGFIFLTNRSIIPKLEQLEYEVTGIFQPPVRTANSNYISLS